jgi:Tfp pilus assembly protein PilX
MSMRFWALFHRANDDERGMVLANVIIFGTVLMTIVAGLLVLSTSGAVKSAYDRNYQNAMSAAYAGLADYQSKISNDNGYAVYGTTTNAQFSATSGSLFQGLGPNSTSNAAFSGFVSVPNSSDEYYRYEVDNSNYASQGILRVRVTGKSGTVTRSLVANLKGDGFINYLYFTNYESAEPAITGDNCTSAYQWSGTSNTCGYVQFAASDTLNGSVRTNDTFTSCGATFNGSVEDYNGTVTKPSGCSASTFNGGSPSSAAYLGMPALNSNMSQEARTDLPTTVPRPGCLYTGPTSVQFNGDGTMTVNSPWTKATQYTVGSNGAIVASTNTAAAASECGSIAALQSSAGATIPTLPYNLMYVQDVPQTNSPANANYWGSSFPTGYTNTYCNTKVTVKANGSSSTASSTTYSNGQGYPQSNEWINGGLYTTSYFGTSYYRTGAASSTYGCTDGDVFVSGGFSGQMTIAASGTVWVTGNITYVKPTTDILGLVGQQAVEVYNPAQCNSTSQGYCVSESLQNYSAGQNLEIDAAIASNAGTFWNENYQFGKALGTLTVKGSIAQNWRGIVATGGSSISTGFAKNYVYDARFLTTAPPKFLQPVSTSYGVTTQVEVQPAYNADGTCAKTSAGVCR